VVADLTPELETLAAIAGAIPYPSLLLAEAHVAITRRILSVIPDHALQLRANWLHMFGVALFQVGRPSEGLPVSEEAVKIRRELASRDTDRYRPDLAVSLFNRGIRFSELDRLAEAVPVTAEAHQIRRELTSRYPERSTHQIGRHQKRVIPEPEAPAGGVNAHCRSDPLNANYTQSQVIGVTVEVRRVPKEASNSQDLRIGGSCDLLTSGAGHRPASAPGRAAARAPGLVHHGGTRFHLDRYTYRLPDIATLVTDERLH
jgi:hypothetical protein